METILIADDHEIVRRGVRMIIESLPQTYSFIEATTGTEVMTALAKHDIQYMILDMMLADGNTFSLIQHIVTNKPQTGILIYSMNAERIYGKRLIKKGIRGFVNKQSSIQELEKAIICLLKREVYLSQALQESLMNESKGRQPDNPIDVLSDRELEVVEYVAAGLGTKEISMKMHLDITTISTYRRRAFAKLNVENMIELNDKFLLYKF